jgi:hypothetical protein
MTQMLNREDFIRENNRIIADTHALAERQTPDEKLETYLRRDAELAEVKDQHKVWLAATYLPGVPVEGTDALYSVAEYMEDLSQGSLDAYYQDVADAFKTALASIQK